MTDLELYAHLEKYVSECHEDGVCFVEPYNYDRFVKKLQIRETPIDTKITIGGILCFDIDEFEWMCEDFDTFKRVFIKNHAVK